MPRTNRPSSSSTGSRSSACSRWSGTRRSRSTAPIPTSTAATCGTRSSPATFPEWELRLQLFDQEFADSFDFDVLDPTKIIPEEVLPPIAGRPAGARPHAGQFLRRDRAGRVHDPERAARHRLLQRSAAAGPQLLLSRHPAEAARQPELHPHSDQRAEMPVRTISSRTATWRCATRRAAPTTSRTRAARARGIARARLPHASPRSSRAPSARLRPESFADHYSQARQFFISQTRVEQKHIADALIFELSKVKTPVIRERMVVASAQHRRDAGRQGRRRARAEGDAEAGRCGDADAAGSRAVAGAQHRRERAGALRGPQARHSGHRRRRRRAAEGAARPRSTRKARCSKSSRRRSAASRPATAAGSRPTRRSMAGRRCSTTRSRCCRRRTAMDDLLQEADGARFRRRRLRALQIHRLRRRSRAAARQGRDPR